MISFLKSWIFLGGNYKQEKWCPTFCFFFAIKHYKFYYIKLCSEEAKKGIGRRWQVATFTYCIKYIDILGV